MGTKFSKGDKVRVKSLGNRIGIIDGDPKEIKGKLFYPISIDPAQPSPFYPKDSLELFIPPKSVEERLKSKEFSPADGFIQTLIYKKLEKPLSDNLYTFYASRTQFLVHQFKPVLKFLNASKQRLLLADEVGLGKTIETGIIITELSARLPGELSRVLVVCPSMLIPKWEGEMHKRFGLDFTPLKRQGFIKFLERYTEYGVAEKIKGIVSLQTLRSKKVIEILRESEPHFDIVIVDEAHYMRNPETLSSELGEVLSELSDAMLFLSATPLQLGTPDLFNLLRLLVPEEFSDFALFSRVIEPNEYLNAARRRLYDPTEALKLLRKVEQTSQADRFVQNPFFQEAVALLSKNINLSREQGVRLEKLLIELNCLSYIFTRTKKNNVDVHFPIREARVIRVQFTPQEMEFYNAVTDFVSERFTTNSRSAQGISFAVIMPQRQVASCIQAMKEELDTMIKKKLVKAPTGDNGDVIDVTWEEDSPWKLENDDVASTMRLKEIAKNLRDTDTKFDKFLEALRKLEKEDPNAKIMVFAFFKKTLEYLKRRLDSTDYRQKVALIHGDVATKDRQRIIRKFRETEQIKILLSSEVGGEGLDFEFCNVIFNYDLPWNPMRVEQRIGRLDRYGQQHEKILIYNFSMEGTIDDEILTRLYRRINVFERYIGDLEAILGEQITELTRDMFNTNLTREQKIQKIERIAQNIATRQKDLEEFESECQKFIGQDEYFTQEITRIQQTKRFVTSEEVMFFLRFFLERNFPKTTLLPPKSGRPGVFVLKCEEDFRRFARQYSPVTENIKELERKLSFDGGMLVTFSDEEACRDQSLEFITIHHPVVKAVKRYYDETWDNIHNTAQFRLKENSNKYRGKYLFFLYLLEKTALKKELLLIPVLVNLSTMKVHIVDELSDWFLAEIVRAEAVANKDFATYGETEFAQALKEASEYLEMIREEEEGKLKQSNDTLVNNQIESVKQAAAIKIRKAEETIAKLKNQGKTEDDPIVRLYRGKIRNFNVSMEQKIRELEGKRAVSVGFNTVAGGVAEIV